MYVEHSVPVPYSKYSNVCHGWYFCHLQKEWYSIILLARNVFLPLLCHYCERLYVIYHGFWELVYLKIPFSSIHAVLTEFSVPVSRWQRACVSSASEVELATRLMGNCDPRSSLCLLVVLADYWNTFLRKPIFFLPQGRCQTLVDVGWGHGRGKKRVKGASHFCFRQILCQTLEKTFLSFFSKMHEHATLEEFKQQPQRKWVSINEFFLTALTRQRQGGGKGSF